MWLWAREGLGLTFEVNFPPSMSVNHPLMGYALERLQCALSKKYDNIPVIPA